MSMRVYLAGPGVFFPDALAWGERLVAACRVYGWQGCYPLDQQVPGDLTPELQRRWIAQANFDLIRSVDAVFADVRAFRSASEPDSGTACEIGFAHALGKPVWLWLPDCTAGSSQRDRVAGVHGEPPRDANGNAVEDFAAPLNLMLWEAAHGASVGCSAEQALAEMAASGVLPATG